MRIPVLLLIVTLLLLWFSFPLEAQIKGDVPATVLKGQKALSLKEWCVVLRNAGDKAYVDMRYESRILFVQLPRTNYRISTESLRWGMAQSSGLRWRTVGDVRFLTMYDEKEIQSKPKEIQKKLEENQKNIMNLMKQGNSQMFLRFEEMLNWNTNADKFSMLVDVFQSRISNFPEISQAYSGQTMNFNKGSFYISLDAQIKTDGFVTSATIFER